MHVDRMDPQRLGSPPSERGPQIVAGNAGREAETVDRLRDVGEGVVTLEVDHEWPGRDEEAAALGERAPVHLADVALRALPAETVGLAVHVVVPAGGRAPRAPRFDTVGDEGLEARVERLQLWGRLSFGQHATVQDPVVDVALA